MLPRTPAEPGAAIVRCRYYISPGESRPRERASWIEISAVQLESQTTQ
jgi:hypothetical protein